ncbi:MAG TPA: ABC transporter permease [Gammaproteobacteria bacterium]|nr:ABC transporter permease [Gammaproteobacteria bacterium]MCP5439051.1 ABC transporter permease [Chromatiaceae bacterium]HPQ23916.1 ABC transporter permease [Gammaproteobacteria bacterium]
MLREILARFGRFQAGYLWAFFTPLAQVAVLYLVWILLKDKESLNVPLVLFLMTGVLPFWTFRQTMRQGATAVIKNKQLLNLPQITIFDVTIAHSVLEMLTMLMVFVIAVASTRLLGIVPHVQDPLGVFIGFALMWMIGSGMGAVFAGMSSRFPALPKFAQPFLGRPLFFTSGLFFTAEMVPPRIREWLLYNPLLHVMEHIRNSFFFEMESPYGDLGYPVAIAVVLWAVGGAIMRINRAELSRQ